MSANLIFLIGVAGSGKSTVGEQLARTLKGCYLDKDTVANRFTGAMLQQAGFAPDARDECEFYKTVVYELEYETLMHIASSNLKIGNSVVLDAPFVGYFANKDYVLNFLKKYDLNDVKATVLRVFVDNDTLKQRIQSRNNPRDTWKLENWDEFIASVNGKKCLWDGVTHLEFDNSASKEDVQNIITELAHKLQS